MFMSLLEKYKIKNKEKAAKNTIKFIEEGFKIVPPNRHLEWASFVTKNSESFDLVECVFETIKALDRGASFEEANKILDNPNQSGASYGFCLWQVAGFAKNGADFVREVGGFYLRDEENKETLKEIEKENAEQIKPSEKQKRISDYVLNGLKMVYPERYRDWVSFVDSNKEGIGESIIKYVVETMQSLDKGDSFEKADNILSNPDQSGSSYSFCLWKVAKFAKRGVGFARTRHPLYTRSEEIQKYLDNIEKENEVLKELERLRKLEEKEANNKQESESENE